MRVDPLSTAIGVQISELDVSASLPQYTLQALKALMDLHGLLLFREQAVTAERQVSLVSAFGPVAANGDGSLFKHVANNPTGGSIDFVSESRLLMHSDLQYAPLALLGLSLYGQSIGAAAPPTLFANAARAYEGLSDALKSRIDSLMVLQATDLRPGSTLSYRPRLADVVGRPHADFPRSVHPLVFRHPRTRTPVLFASEHQSVHIVGLSEMESETLIEELFGALYRQENMYRHEWRPGDLLIWDNISLQHGRPETPAGSPRVLRRVVLASHSQTYLELAAATG
jgi:alpha-ketoglutarate-dependent taurine dioxygenase